MRFREGAIGQKIGRVPGGKYVFLFGGSVTGIYYWFKYRKYGELAAVPWILFQSRDALTVRILTNRLKESERAKKYLPVHLRCVDGTLLVRPESTDRRLVKQIFGDGEYRPIDGWTYRTVLDCGANCGLFAAYAQSQGGAILQAYIGVEPDPESFDILSEMLQIRGMRSISRLFQAAVAETDGTARFDTTGDSWVHRLADQGSLQVRTLSINSLLDRAGLAEVDLLKLDIEGGEKAVMETLPAWRDRVRCIVIELHQNWHPLTFDWFASLVRASGYVPMRAGTLFGCLPGAIREDVINEKRGS